MLWASLVFSHQTPCNQGVYVFITPFAILKAAFYCFAGAFTPLYVCITKSIKPHRVHF
jgi:hypothetical protein